jgi:prepilin-type N-terminal cleavage/methylation domain-containing protein
MLQCAALQHEQNIISHNRKSNTKAMNKKHFQHQKGVKINRLKTQHDGFSISELIVATSIVGILSSIALPNYMSSMQRSERSEVQSIIASVPSIMGAYIDATGELPTQWDDLSSIAAVMTNNGPATGELTNPIILQKSNYELSIEGPTESIYSLKATPRIARNTDEPGDPDEKRFAIYSCFNVSNGASDLKSGYGIEIKATLNCG